MLKMYDWECLRCGFECESIIEVEADARAPKQALLDCPACGSEQQHRRLPSLFARVLGEKLEARHAPEIYGGRFDTMGKRALTRLPEMAGEAEYDAKVQAAIAASGAETIPEMHAAAAEVGPGPDAADYVAHFATPEWREAKKQRKREAALNAQKELRSHAIKAREASVRSWPCEGDDPALKKGAS